jgi:hypothetical protein
MTVFQAWFSINKGHMIEQIVQHRMDICIDKLMYSILDININTLISEESKAFAYTSTIHTSKTA